MFEVGKSYRFEMIEDGRELTFEGTVEAYDHPLLKIADREAVRVIITGQDPADAEERPIHVTKGPIINVISPAFKSAVEVEKMIARVVMVPAKAKTA